MLLVDIETGGRRVREEFETVKIREGGGGGGQNDK